MTFMGDLTNFSLLGQATSRIWNLTVQYVQCGNYRILCEIKVSESRVSKWIFIFWSFSSFWMLKSTKLTKFRASKMAKTAFLELLDSHTLIWQKIWMTENPEISKLCRPEDKKGRFRTSRFFKIDFTQNPRGREICKYVRR